MRCRLILPLLCLIACHATRSHAQVSAPQELKPVNFSLKQQPESVYAPPAPTREDQGVNEGGVNLDLTITYMTDYIFRGIEILEPPGSEDRINLQIDGKLSFDLGKAPHPFVAVFANIAESDPISTFQEIRPSLGFDWTLRPFVLSAGYTSYIYPDRDDMETQEVWARVELDDSYFFKTDKPIISPYVFGAYDIDLYDGTYVEAGISHDFEFEDFNLTIRTEASVAYVYDFALFEVNPGDDQEEHGFQHYQLGLIGTYDLNDLLNIPLRYGEWSIVGYLYYTDGIDDDLRAATELYGGAGIRVRY